MEMKMENTPTIPLRLFPEDYSNLNYLRNVLVTMGSEKPRPPRSAQLLSCCAPPLSCSFLSPLAVASPPIPPPIHCHLHTLLPTIPPLQEKVMMKCDRDKNGIFNGPRHSSGVPPHLLRLSAPRSSSVAAHGGGSEAPPLTGAPRISKPRPKTPLRIQAAATPTLSARAPLWHGARP